MPHKVLGVDMAMRLLNVDSSGIAVDEAKRLGERLNRLVGAGILDHCLICAGKSKL